MNPCPVHDERTATVFLFFIAVRGRTPEAAQIASGRNAARLCCVTSRDAGRSWGGARDLTAEAVGSAEQGRWARPGLRRGEGRGVHPGLVGGVGLEDPPRPAPSPSAAHTTCPAVWPCAWDPQPSGLVAFLSLCASLLAPSLGQPLFYPFLLGLAPHPARLGLQLGRLA